MCPLWDAITHWSLPERSKKRSLFVQHHIPWPLNSAFQLRAANNIKPNSEFIWWGKYRCTCGVSPSYADMQHTAPRPRPSSSCWSPWGSLSFAMQITSSISWGFITSVDGKRKSSTSQICRSQAGQHLTVSHQTMCRNLRETETLGQRQSAQQGSRGVTTSLIIIYRELFLTSKNILPIVM